MSDIMAAIGRVQLKKSNKMFARRKEIRKRYVEAFKTVSAIELYNIDTDNSEIVPHIFPIKVSLPDNLIEHLFTLVFKQKTLPTQPCADFL